MSIQAVAWAIKVRAGGTTNKAVLMALANYADEAGQAWPSLRTLMRDCEIANRSTLVDTLRDLASTERGLIVIQQRKRDVGSSATNLYTLAIGQCPSQASGVGAESRQPAQGGGPIIGPGVVRSPDQGGPLTGPLEPSLNPSVSPKQPEDPQKVVWDRAILCLTKQGGMPDQAARSFFGRLLKLTKLKASDLADVVENAIQTQSADPRSYLRAAADAEAKRRSSGAPAVGQVAEWSEERWGIALDLAARRALWPAEWGPRVGEPGCIVPEALWSRAAELGLTAKVA